MNESCNPEQLVSGTVPLTSALLADIEKGLLESLDPAEVSPYLEQNLRYKISMMDGAEPGKSIQTFSLDFLDRLVELDD